MSDLETFSFNIPNINVRPPSELIQFFAYYLQEVKGLSPISASNITSCFNELCIKPYSNISSFLSLKAKGKKAIFIKQKKGYTLTKQAKESIARELSIKVEIPVSDALINLSIVDSTPYYIQGIAKQMAQCYECSFYDATLVLMRKLVETLIIETFERFGIDDSIKDTNGDFFYLSNLIPAFLNSLKWNPSRNLHQNIAKIKKYGDLSAHNRRFQAKKTDIDNFKFELRQVLQEIILTIDYPNWDKSSK
ncbi:MAG: hypothetical protein GX451_03170 [Acholeplasmataceae bacterium]|nr:hypothetical protein [Acholeplasmataceae bacterium]